MAWFRKDKKSRFQPDERTSQIPEGLWIKRIGDSSRLVPDPKAAEALMAGYQAYPYAQRENPRKTRIIAAKGQKRSGWPEGAMEFWRLLARMLDRLRRTGRTTPSDSAPRS